MRCWFVYIKCVGGLSSSVHFICLYNRWNCIKHAKDLFRLCILLIYNGNITCNIVDKAQALVSFKRYMPPPLPYFKVNIYPFPLPHFASIFFAYLWFFRWPNYIVTLPRYFSFRLPHLNIPTADYKDMFNSKLLTFDF